MQEIDIERQRKDQQKVQISVNIQFKKQMLLNNSLKNRKNGLRKNKDDFYFYNILSSHLKQI